MDVLIFPYKRALAHNVRCVEIGKALQERGYEVAIAQSHLPHFLGNSVPTIPHEGYGSFTATNIAESIQEEINTIQSYNPKLVISDLCPSLRASAKICGVPHIAIANNADFILKVPVRFARASLAFTVMDLPPIREYCKQHLVNTHLKEFNKAISTFGLRPERSASRPLRGRDHTCIADLESLCDIPVKHDRMTHVGPIFYNSTHHIPRQEDRPARSAYVTMGATGTRTIINTAIEALKEWILQTSGGSDLSRPGTEKQSGEVHLIDSNKALQQSELMIYTGSALCTYQAMLSQTPMIAIPLNLSQSYYADMIERLGVGRRLDLWNLTPTKLRNTAEALRIDPHCRQQLQILSNLVKNTNGSRTVATICENYLTT